ncbi:MAG: ISAzo13 family transposase [Actinomycetes bacterium]
MPGGDVDDEHFLRFFRTLNERQARLCAAERALALGRGGITRLAQVTGLSPKTIRKGIAELRGNTPPAVALPLGRSRRPGGGRKKVEDVAPGLLAAVQEVVEASTAGSPEDVLRWTSTSKAKIAAALEQRGYSISPNTVGRLLREQLDYHLQANRKDKEGRAPPERDAQFRYLNAQARAFLGRGQPVLSVDTKKKELIGEFKNAGRTWRPKGDPIRVNTHDFPSQAVGKAIPYGIYDLAQNRGFVNVGTSHDTAAFAVESLRWWWTLEGQQRYGTADSLLLLADSGGSNSARTRLWKLRVQEWADELQRPITVCHLPPGTSKWNKIEHRLFAYISIHWRGRPLLDYETVVSLIGATTTETGLTVSAQLDRADYPTGQSVSDATMAQLRLRPHDTHPQWNYTLLPRSS